VQRLAETDGVSVTGRVDDVRPELLAAAVSVSSLRLGRGVPNKILEALGLGMSVVTTSNGAAGLALDEFPGVDVADEPAEFARAVVRRLKEAQGGRVRYPEHRALLKQHYSWPSAEAAFLKLARGDA
ncbi:MAG: glycosyltransferase family 4 protein, partial [Planctomycetota bacterium]